jgi:hypothetical protein
MSKETKSLVPTYASLLAPWIYLFILTLSDPQHRIVRVKILKRKKQNAEKEGEKKED